MKRRVILTATVTIGVMCVATFLILAQGINIVDNPTFATGGSGWNVYWWNGYQWSDYSGSYEHTSGGGTGAGFIVNDEDPSLAHDPVFFAQSVMVTPTESYAGYFWLYDDTDEAFLQVDPYNCTSGPYPIVWAIFPQWMGCATCDEPTGSCWDQAFGYGSVTADSQSSWQAFSFSFSVPATYTDTEASLCFLAWNDDGVSECGYHVIDDVYAYTGAPTTPVPPPPQDCGLENYSFSDGLEGWEQGEWLVEGDGWIGIHGNGDELNSYIAQTVTLQSTGPASYYELAISSRNFFPVPDGSEPLLRWKLNSRIPGDSPDWYDGQAHVWEDEYWQVDTWVLRPSNSPALTDTLTIWSKWREVKIDNVCITLHYGPADITPVCPISPTYTPNPTYTPLPTPSPATTATATAWAATATAWPTPPIYPTVPAPNCDPGEDNEPDWSFIWLMGQIVALLGAFFEAIFQLLGNVLQPIFDLIGFVVWLLGAAFGLIARLIDLIGAVLQFLLSFLGLSFDILEIIGSFFVALWQVITSEPVDPGFEIPSYFAWPLAAWNLLIADTPLELLEPVALAVGSLLMIIWTIKQFSGSTSD